jgi:hypothetical protein
MIEITYLRHTMMTKLLIIMLGGLLVCRGSELTNRITDDQQRYTISNTKMIWGEATNFISGDLSGGSLLTSLRSGIDVSNGIITLSGKPLRPLHPTRLFIENHSGPPWWTFPTTYDQGIPNTHVPSTNWVFAFMPPVSERCEIAMTDKNGRPVPKTPAGLALGQPPTLKPNTKWFRFARNNHTRFGLTPKQVDEVELSDPAGRGALLTPENVAKARGLDPTAYFVLEEPGLYRLTIAQRLYVADTNSCVKAITLPPVAVNVSVQK